MKPSQATKWTGRMIYSLAAILACFPPSRPATAQDAPGPQARLYAPGTIWPVHITVSTGEYDAIQPKGGMGFPGFRPPAREPEAPGKPKREVHRNNFGMDLPWGTGSITVGDRDYGTVGIRYKGNGTIGDASRTIKKSFKIDLDRAGGTGRFGGSKTINLHCGVTDPSKCRETLGYEIYREAKVIAPRTTLAEVRLTVPGRFDKELLGLYTIVEEVDKPFLKDRFGDEAGLLMKPERLRDFEDRGDEWERYREIYKPRRVATAKEAERIVAFARLVHRGDDAAFDKGIENHLDVEGYLRFLAATAFLSNSDSFFALGHNYYLCLDPKTNKLGFIPWDLDRAFANFFIYGTPDQQMDLSLAHPYSGAHRLTERILAIPRFADLYRKLLKELSATVFAKDKLLKRLAEAEALVREPLERDARAATARKDGVGGFGPPGRFPGPPGLREFFEKRDASLTRQLAGEPGHIPRGGFPFGPR